jgi:sulfur carrier protein
MDDSLEVTVNGEPRRVPQGTTVRGLLDLLGLRGMVAVERNRDIVPRAEHGTTALCAGDALEIVHFVGGG